MTAPEKDDLVRTTSIKPQTADEDGDFLQAEVSAGDLEIAGS